RRYLTNRGNPRCVLPRLRLCRRLISRRYRCSLRDYARQLRVSCILLYYGLLVNDRGGFPSAIFQIGLTWRRCLTDSWNPRWRGFLRLRGTQSLCPHWSTLIRQSLGLCSRLDRLRSNVLTPQIG